MFAESARIVATKRPHKCCGASLLNSVTAEAHACFMSGKASPRPMVNAAVNGSTHMFTQVMLVESTIVRASNLQHRHTEASRNSSDLSVNGLDAKPAHANATALDEKRSRSSVDNEVINAMIMDSPNSRHFSLQSSKQHSKG